MSRLDFTRWRGLSAGFIPAAVLGIDMEAGRIDALDGEGRAVSFSRHAHGWQWEETTRDGETTGGRVSNPSNLELSARRMARK